MEMPVKLIAVVPVLVRVTVFGAPVLPNVTLPQVRVDGDADPVPPVEAAPVPESEAARAVLPAVIFQAALSAPAAPGLKSMSALQVADAARLEPHVVVETSKSAASVPESPAPLRATEPDVLLLTVTVCDELVDPTLVVPNDKPVGDEVTLPVPLVPRPVRATCCGLPDASSLKFSVAVRVPEVVGLKRMVAAQLADAARVEPQVFLKISKSPESVPVRSILLMVMVEVPVLVSVADFCAPA